MSTRFPNPGPGNDMHVCLNPACTSTDSEALGWHHNQATRLLHTLKQQLASKNYAGAADTATILGSHRAHVGTDLARDIEETVNQIPIQFLDPEVLAEG